MKRNFLAGLFGGVLGVLVIFLMINMTSSVGAWSSDQQELETALSADQVGITVDAEPIQVRGSGPNTDMVTTITYQGQLKVNNVPYTGNCDMLFRLWNGDPGSGGIDFGWWLPTVAPVLVTNGLFTVYIDFGPLAFDGFNRAIEPQVRCPSGSGSYVLLGAQSVTAVPYALSLVPGAMIRGINDFNTLEVNSVNVNLGSRAIRGVSGYGIAISGESLSPSASAIEAANYYGGPALAIAAGGIKVVDAGVGTNTPAFIHQVSSGNICPSINYATIINNTLINGKPNAILIVTPNNAGGTPPRTPVGVFYDATNICGYGQRWAVYDLSATPQPLVLGQTFNVFAVTP